MITGPRSSFEARLMQRGYTLEEVSACIVAHDGDQITVDETHPAYPRTAKPPPPLRLPAGPGTELKKLLRRVGIVATPGCSCNARAAEMDSRGCDWVAANESTVVGWLREEAAKRGLPFLDAAGKLLVRRAIANARKEAERAKKNEGEQASV